MFIFIPEVGFLRGQKVRIIYAWEDYTVYTIQGEAQIIIEECGTKSPILKSLRLVYFAALLNCWKPRSKMQCSKSKLSWDSNQ